MGNSWSVAWRVHDAQFWGVPQRRKRISLVADFGGESAPEILFERQGLSGNSEESREEGQGIATNTERSIDKTSKCLNAWDVQSKHIQPENGIAEALYAGECRYAGGESYVLQNKAISFQEQAGKPGGGKGILIQNERTGALSTLNNQSVVYCLQGNGIDRADTAGCNGKGWRENQSYTLNTIDRPAVCAIESHPQDSRVKLNNDDINQPLSANMCHDPANGGLVLALENHPADSRVKISEDGVVQTLSGRMGTGGGNVPMVMEQPIYTIGHDERSAQFTTDEKTDPLTVSDYKDPIKIADCRKTYQNVTGTLSQGAHPGSYNGQDAYSDMFIANQSIVRRLTPLECERLQGYPDNWTNIGEWIDSKGKKRQCTDGNRYKALGNSIALPYWEWMAERMVKELNFENPTMASLFDGIGGFPLVYSRCGCEPIWASEIEEFPIAVTKLRFSE